MRLLSPLLLSSFACACSSVPPGHASVVGGNDPVAADPATPVGGGNPGETPGVVVDPDVALAVSSTALDQARYYVVRDSNGVVQTVWLMLSNLQENPCSVRCEDTAVEPAGTIAKLNLRLSVAPSVGTRPLTDAEARGSSFILTQPGCDDERGTVAESALLGHRSMNALGGELQVDHVDLSRTLSGSVDLLLPVGSLSGEFNATHCSELDTIVPAFDPAATPGS